ncbi:hypothetical protein KR026_011768, partial [Drosophila bipectinata]
VSNAAMVQDDHVYIKVLADNETMYRYKIKSNTKLARLMGAYSQQTGLSVRKFRFYYRGKPVDKNDTVHSLALPWGSIINAF